MSGRVLPAGFDLTSLYGAASTCGPEASGHVSVSGPRRPFFDHVRSPTPEPYLPGVAGADPWSSLRTRPTWEKHDPQGIGGNCDGASY